MSKSLMDELCPVGVTTTGLINGLTSGVLQLNSVKYQWAYNLWEVMLNNTWFPKEVDLTKDVLDYKKLSASAKHAYDKTLSQLIFMDGIQTNNTVDNINSWITAPEINLCLVRQAFEEALHSQSYAVMVDSISANTNEIYEEWRRNKILHSKNKHILNVYQEFAQSKDDITDFRSKILSVVANQCLEGIYFYTGFAVMYSLARGGQMIGSSQMIRFIQRDEITHLTLFSNIFKDIRREHPAAFTEAIYAEIVQMIKIAVEHEITWGKYLISGGILGLNEDIIERFVKYLANSRCQILGIQDIYPEIGHKINPIPWFDDFSKIKNIKTNFFEGNNTAYSKGSVSMDF